MTTSQAGSKNARGPSAPNHDIQKLEGIARELRRDAVQTIYQAGSGHPGGSLSEMDILVALYFGVLRHDPLNPHWPDRDRFILSKGHACPGLYVVLAKRGYFPREELWGFRKTGAMLQGHAHPKTPGVEMNSGSLGQGLSFGIGACLAGRLEGKRYKVYVLLGDGECDEGQVWEAAMSAAHYDLSNLIAIVDRNRIQNDRFTDDVMKLEPLASKWRAFGWRVIETDGHDMSQLLNVFQQAGRSRGRPTLVLAHTTKGRGVRLMENNPDFHGRAPNREEYDQAMKELA